MPVAKKQPKFKFTILVVLNEGSVKTREIEATPYAAADATQEIAKNGMIEGDMYNFVVSEGKNPTSFTVYPPSSIRSVSLALTPPVPDLNAEDYSRLP
jgi:hypothetical protein